MILIRIASDIIPAGLLSPLLATQNPRILLIITYRTQHPASRGVVLVRRRASEMALPGRSPVRHLLGC